jgi:hypothetical protein
LECKQTARLPEMILSWQSGCLLFGKEVVPEK